MLRAGHAEGGAPRLVAPRLVRVGLAGRLGVESGPRVDPRVRFYHPLLVGGQGGRGEVTHGSRRRAPDLAGTSCTR